MPNRVAELESTVAELQATVDGLQGELVDANERIRALERQLEARDAVQSEPEPGVRDTSSTDRTPSSLDDIIVA